MFVKIDKKFINMTSSIKNSEMKFACFNSLVNILMYSKKYVSLPYTVYSLLNPGMRSWSRQNETQNPGRVCLCNFVKVKV